LSFAELDFSFVDKLGTPPGPYERLFHEAIISHQSLFTREDVVEETWRVLQPLIDRPPAIEKYKRGSWGPARLKAECTKTTRVDEVNGNTTSTTIMSTPD
jgi:glucose-6-phosphate 1-dehydrogenase